MRTGLRRGERQKGAARVTPAAPAVPVVWALALGAILALSPTALAALRSGAGTGAAAGATPGEAVREKPFRLKRVEIAGPPLLDRGAALALLEAAPGDSLRAADLRGGADRIRERLVGAGWWGASVRPEEQAGVVTFTIDAGEPVVIGEIAIRGNRLLSAEELRARMDLRSGRVFDEAVFRADVARLLRAYSERGYARARVYPGGFRRSVDGRLDFTVRIGEGPATEIESVRVFGATTTEESIVARIGGVRPGDRWNVRRIEGMASRLRREGLFLSVGEPRVVRGSRDNRVGVEIEVEEGPANSLFGVLGYNPDPGGGGEVVGQVDFQLRNIVGTARRAHFRFERQQRDVRDLAFRYREPWLAGTPLSVEVGAAQSLRDTLYSRTDLDAGLSVPLGDRSVATVRAERRSSSFDDATGESRQETSTGGSVGLRFDARDRRLNPGRGWRAAALLGARESEAGVLRSRAEVDGQVLLPLGRRWVVSEEAGFRGVESDSGPTPTYEQYYVGGTNTLRGYREEQFRGDRVWWVRSELRYRLSLRSRAYTFTDVGGFVAHGAGADSDVLAGGGFGISLETRGQGLVRLEIAVGRGDGFSDAKVHAGLEQEF